MNDKILEWMMVYVSIVFLMVVIVMTYTVHPIVMVLVVPAIALLAFWTRTSLGYD